MPPRVTRSVTASNRQRNKTLATQRNLKPQTGGIFKLPLEILLEIFSHLKDHRDFIDDVRHVGITHRSMKREHVERSTVIRNLTMTCRLLRDALLPVLWKDAEGCVISNCPLGGNAYGLYDQCEYLLSNPVVAVYVQVLSVDLVFKASPADLMKKFVDTLLQLPNLRRLELLTVSHRSSVTVALKRKDAIFPNIREMVVDRTYPDFIKSCPNLKSLTFRHGFTDSASRAIEMYGAGLKRVTGVRFQEYPSIFIDPMETLIRCCPKLQEIGLVSEPDWLRSNHVFNQLRKFEHLAIIEIDFIQIYYSSPTDWREGTWVAWKRGFIEVLKESPSRDRKMLRWKLIYGWNRPSIERDELVANGEMEIFPDTPL